MSTYLHLFSLWNFKRITLPLCPAASWLDAWFQSDQLAPSSAAGERNQSFRNVSQVQKAKRQGVVIMCHCDFYRNFCSLGSRQGCKSLYAAVRRNNLATVVNKCVGEFRNVTGSSAQNSPSGRRGKSAREARLFGMISRCCELDSMASSNHSSCCCLLQDRFERWNFVWNSSIFLVSTGLVGTE